MKTNRFGFLDRLTTILIHCTGQLTPAERQDWFLAMRAELSAIDAPIQRLSFVWGCFVTASGLSVVAQRGEPIARILLGLVLLMWAIIKARFFWFAIEDASAFKSWELLVHQTLAIHYALLALAIMLRHSSLIFSFGALVIASNAAIYAAQAIYLGETTVWRLALVMEDHFVTMMTAVAMLVLGSWRLWTDRIEAYLK